MLDEKSANEQACKTTGPKKIVIKSLNLFVTKCTTAGQGRVPDVSGTVAGAVMSSLSGLKID